MSVRDENFTYAKRIAHRYGVARAFTFWRAALRGPQQMQEWLGFVKAQVPDELVDGLAMRPLRPYMRQHFTVMQRRNLLRDHYTVMAQHFTSLDSVRDEPGLIVSTLVGKNDAAYTVHFGGNTSKEGELSFALCDADGDYLARIAGTIGRDDAGKLILWIGGQQGAKPPKGRDEVVKATKDLFGLRPKGAVILALQCFAQMLGVASIHAPGNEGHISQRGGSFLKLNKRVIYADYGQFWEEIGGVKIGDDEYALPVTPQVRDVSEVKPHKRSEWKKRQALSEQLAADLRLALAKLQKAY